jgi:hypothetical protein
LAQQHPFDRAIALTPAASGDGAGLTGAPAQGDAAERGRMRRLVGQTSPDYWNVAGPFGGITAATLLNAVLLQPDRLPVPLALTVSYCGAIRQGAFDIAVRCLRGGRTTQHWAVDLTQGPDREVMASALVVCVLRRDTWGAREARPPEVDPAPAQFGARPGKGPPWLVHYREHLVRGELFRGNPHSETVTWVADAPARALDYPALAAICDAFFPRIFLRRPTFVPVATVSLNVYFHAGHQIMAEQGATPVLAQASGQVFNEGFCDQEGRVWGLDDHLLATTHQVVWYKE